MARRRIEAQLMSIRHEYYNEEIRDLVIRHRRAEGMANELSDDVLDIIWSEHSSILLSSSKSGRRLKSNRMRDPLGQLTASGREAVRALLREALEDEESLKGLSPAELDVLYTKEYGKYAYNKKQKRLLQGKENDIGAPFNDLEANANLEHWLSMDTWSIEEAAKLSFGKDPTYVKSEWLKPYNPVVPSKFRSEYGVRISLIERAVESGVLSIPLKPREFVQWCQTKHLKIHSDLLSAWPSAISVEYEELENKYNEAMKEIKLLKSILAEDDIDNETALRKRSIYRIILGMAIAGFQHTTVGNSNATAKIEKALEKLKIPIRQRTIKKTLDEALESVRKTNERFEQLKPQSQ